MLVLARSLLLFAPGHPTFIGMRVVEASVTTLVFARSLDGEAPYPLGHRCLLLDLDQSRELMRGWKLRGFVCSIPRV